MLISMTLLRIILEFLLCVIYITKTMTIPKKTTPAMTMPIMALALKLFPLSLLVCTELAKFSADVGMGTNGDAAYIVYSEERQIHLMKKTLLNVKNNNKCVPVM